MDKHQQRARLLGDEAIKQELKRLEREKKEAQQYKKALIAEMRFRRQHESSPDCELQPAEHQPGAGHEAEQGHGEG